MWRLYPGQARRGRVRLVGRRVALRSGGASGATAGRGARPGGACALWARRAAAYHRLMQDEPGAPTESQDHGGGQTLWALLGTQGPLPLQRAGRLLASLCARVEEAHLGGRVLGGLHPRDVWIAAAGREDEHVARIAGPAGPGEGAEDRAAARAAYASPEAAQGGEGDAVSDVYSLGALAYEVITGRPPFQAATPAALAIKHILEPPRPPRELRPEVPPALEAAVLRALHKDRAARQGSANELGREIEAALSAGGAGEPVAAPAAAMVPGAGPGALSGGAAPDLVAKTLAGPAARRPAGPGRWLLPGLGAAAACLVVAGLLSLRSRPAAMAPASVSTAPAPRGKTGHRGGAPAAEAPVHSAAPAPPPSPEMKEARDEAPPPSPEMKKAPADAPPPAMKGAKADAPPPRRKELAKKRGGAKGGGPPPRIAAPGKRTPTAPAVVGSAKAPPSDNVPAPPPPPPPPPMAPGPAAGGPPPSTEAPPVPSSQPLPAWALALGGAAAALALVAAAWLVLRRRRPGRPAELATVTTPDGAAPRRPSGPPWGAGPVLPTGSAMAPFVVGQYQCFARLGEGGMGMVYKARHVTLDRVAAIKVLLPHIAGRESAVLRFQREARLASSINHPNSVFIYDYGELDSSLFYLAMEFIEGQPLADIIEPGDGPPQTLPMERVLHITRQICSVLDIAHQQGIVHRDLKPQNVMICQRPHTADHVKVVDFGIARSLTAPSATATGMVMGTPAYMSPEQANGLPDIDGRSDIFSLGMLVYRMLGGSLPFADTAMTPMQQIIQRALLREPPPPLRSVRPDLRIPPGVEAALSRALEPDPRRRTPTALGFIQDLERAAG